MIQRGHSIVYSVARGKFVHYFCGRVQVRPQRRRPVAMVAEECEGIPTGLKAATLATYASEWTRYERFARSRGHVHIPGEHVPWDLALQAGFGVFFLRTLK